MLKSPKIKDILYIYFGFEHNMNFENFNIVDGIMGNGYFLLSGFHPRVMIGGRFRYVFVLIKIP